MSLTSRRRAALAAVAGLAVSVCAACGTTVSGTGAAAADTAAGEFAGTATTPSGPVAAAGGTNTGSDSAGLFVGTAGRSTGDGGAGAASTVQTGSSPASAPGVIAGKANTPGVLKIGVPFPDDAGTLYSAFGIHSASTNPQDFEAMVRALFNYANAHGGFGGRTAVPEFYLYRFESGGDFPTQMQAMCAHFTQDVPVFAVIFFFGNAYDPLPSCLAQHHTALILDTNSAFYDDAQLAALGPYYYRPFMASLWATRAQIQGLHHFGFFSGVPRIGVLRWDDPQGKRTYDNIVVPTLASYGLKVTKEYAYSPIQSVGDASTLANESNNAVLQFRSANVDRIITVASNAAFPFLFATAADPQGYHPKYGMSSMDIPGFQPGNAPAGQLPNMVGIGWNRAFDIDFNNSGSTAADLQIPAYKKCLALYHKAGVSNGNPFDCALVFFLQRALLGVNAPTAAALRAGVTALASTFQGAATVGLHFTAGRDDGIAAARYVTYNTNCSCMQYSSGIVPIS